MLLESDHRLSIAENLGEQTYEELHTAAVECAAILQVPEEISAPTFALLQRLYEFDEKTAKESLQALPLALGVAQCIADFYPGAEVNMHYVWAATILHDIGKITLPKELIDKSNAGKSWSAENIETMKGHAQEGGRIARLYGLPESVCRAIEEHHHRQYGAPNYGPNAELNNVERITRDCLAVADFTDAMLNRTNSRNVHMDREQRKYEIYNDIHFVFNDYTQGDILAKIIHERMVES